MGERGKRWKILGWKTRGPINTFKITSSTSPSSLLPTGSPRPHSRTLDNPAATTKLSKFATLIISTESLRQIRCWRLQRKPHYLHFILDPHIIFMSPSVDHNEFYENWERITIGRAKLLIGKRSAPLSSLHENPSIFSFWKHSCNRISQLWSRAFRSHLFGQSVSYSVWPRRVPLVSVRIFHSPNSIPHWYTSSELIQPWLRWPWTNLTVSSPLNAFHIHVDLVS